MRGFCQKLIQPTVPLKEKDITNISINILL